MSRPIKSRIKLLKACEICGCRRYNPCNCIKPNPNSVTQKKKKHKEQNG